MHFNNFELFFPYPSHIFLQSIRKFCLESLHILMVGRIFQAEGPFVAIHYEHLYVNLIINCFRFNSLLININKIFNMIYLLKIGILKNHIGNFHYFSYICVLCTMKPEVEESMQQSLFMREMRMSFFVPGAGPP